MTNDEWEKAEEVAKWLAEMPAARAARVLRSIDTSQRAIRNVKPKETDQKFHSVPFHMR